MDKKTKKDYPEKGNASSSSKEGTQSAYGQGYAPHSTAGYTSNDSSSGGQLKESGPLQQSGTHSQPQRERGSYPLSTAASLGTTSTTSTQRERGPTTPSTLTSGSSYGSLSGSQSTSLQRQRGSGQSVGSSHSSTSTHSNKHYYGRLLSEYDPSVACPRILNQIYSNTYRPVANCVEDSLRTLIGPQEMAVILSSARKKDYIGKALHLYSMDNTVIYDNLAYKGISPLLNEALFTNNEQVLRLLGDFLYFLIVAVQQCPVVKDVTVWRGMVLDESLLGPNYNALQLISWYGINSCSKKESIAIEFTTEVNNDIMILQQQPHEHDRRSVLCRINNCTGYLVSDYSKFKEEEEVILLPGSKMTVLQKTYPHHLTVLHLIQAKHDDFVRKVIDVTAKHRKNSGWMSDYATLKSICIVAGVVVIVGGMLLR
jgi:hypothetical protein